MAITIGNSSIKNIYVGDSKVKAVYLGDNLVYGVQTEPPVEETIDKTYNYFVFDTSKVSGTTTVILQNYRAGDTTAWDGLTDWGDGTIDNNTSHTYASDGTYTVKTKYMINNESLISYDDGFGDNNTEKMLVECTNVNNNITKMIYLFYNCRNLLSVDLSRFSVNNVTNMKSMFNFCKSLVSVNFYNFDTSKVTDMSYMFSSCESLISIDLSSFNTSNVITMENMFISCESLISLDLSSFNTSNVTRMLYMFSNCYALTHLNISNFDTNNTIGSSGTFFMFGYCNNLTINNIIMTNCNEATKTKITEAFNSSH